MSKLVKLPESELDIMLALWSLGGEASAPSIGASLGRDLTASALHSYLKRLEDRQFVRRTKEGKVNVYTALVSEAEYRSSESSSVLDKLYDGSLKNFAAALWDGGKLSQGDVRELKAYLDELERGNH